MNFNVIEKVIEYIEVNNCVLENDRITNITGKSAGYIRNEFKKVTGISLDKYRIRRQLSIIIKNVKKSAGTISSHDLSPWGSRNSFNKAFKNEFNLSPSDFIKRFDEEQLQSKFDVNFAKNQYDNESRLIEGLTRKYGSESRALLFLLTLEPYELELISKLFVNSYDQLIYNLIRLKYANQIGERFFSGEIPKDFVMKNCIRIQNYYNKFQGFTIKKDKGTLQKDNILMQNILINDYFISNRSLLEKLISKVDFPNLLYNEVSPTDLRTIWYERCRGEGVILLPNELISSSLNTKEYHFLHELLIIEQGHKIPNTWEALVEIIKYDYDKFIDHQELLCVNCKYKKECDKDDDCRLFEEMSEEEQNEYISKPDWEQLSLKKLMEDIVMLLKKGYLYVENETINGK